MRERRVIGRTVREGTVRGRTVREEAVKEPVGEKGDSGTRR